MDDSNGADGGERDLGAGYSEEEQHAIARAWREPAGRKRGVQVSASATSTQDLVRESVGPRGSPALLVVASEQTAGRGTRGRQWTQDGHDDIGFSFSIEPNFDPRLLPMLVAVAVRQALLEWLRHALDQPDAIRLKWPNDVLFRGEDGSARKLCGILIESLDAGRWIVGVGLNVNRTAFDSELRDVATSLRLATGQSIDRAGLLCTLLRTLRRLIEAASESIRAIESLYEEGLMLVGRVVDIRLTGRTVTGRLAEVRIERVRLEDGTSFAPGEIEGISSSRE